MIKKIKVAVKMLVIFVLFIVGNISAQEQIDIISGKTGLASGWEISVSKWWGTIVTENMEIVKEGKALSIQIDIDPNTGKPWSGATFSDKDTKEFSNAIMIKKSYLEDGILSFYINGGKDILGRFQGSQDIQVLLGFLKRDNTKWIPKAGEVSRYILIKEYLDGKTIDNDSDTWQEVNIPIKLYLDKVNIDEIIGIISISFQFYGSSTPQSGFYITDVKISPAKQEVKNIQDKVEEDVYFSEFNDLDKSILMPEEIKIEGPNYIVSGKPRFLIGTELAEGDFNTATSEKITTPGYAQKYKWIYEKIMGYEEAQKLGFDTLGFFSSNGWVQEKYSSNIRTLDDKSNESRHDRFIKEIKLPIYVDFTMFPWAGGQLANTKLIPEKAKSDPNLKQHWLLFDPDNEDGMKLYKTYWAYGTKKVVENDGNPLFYELFNEPSYFCECDENRKNFAVWLETKYKNIEELNKIWNTKYSSYEEVAQFKSKIGNIGLYVDYAKFLEDRFVQINKEGIETIKAIDTRKNVQITCQPMGNVAADPHTSSYNYYKLNKIFNTIQAPTSAGGKGYGIGSKKPTKELIDTSIQNLEAVKSSITMSILRSIAPDKPIVDGEMAYPQPTREGMKNAFWNVMMRGENAGYLFVWTRRAWDWKPNTQEGGIALAKRFPYLILNPYGYPTSSLPGILDFKKEMLLVDDIVVPRPKGIKSEIAYLHSYSSRRFAYISKEPTMSEEMMNYYAALEYSHYPFDTILEEQIRDENAQKKYKVIVAGGINYVEPKVKENLDKFVQDGGILILGLDTIAYDEYGNKLENKNWAGVESAISKQSKIGEITLHFPQTNLLKGKIRGLLNRDVEVQTAEIIGSVEDKPVITMKEYGKGKIYYIGGLFRDYHLMSIIVSILEKEKINIPVQVVDKESKLVPNVEMVLIDRGDTKAVFLWNWDLYTKLGKVIIPSDFIKDSVYVYEPLEGKLDISPSGKKQWSSKELQEGIWTILQPQNRVLIVFSKNPWNKTKLNEVMQNLIPKEYEKIAIVERNKEEKQKKDETEGEKKRNFEVNPNNCWTVDIRKWTNRDFVDRVEGDGEGGWTDQGRQNSLEEMDYGIQTLLNVPYDIIRPDFNRDTSCIVMSSKSMKGGIEKVEGISVNKQAKRLFFLHVSAWTGGQRESSHKYIIHYSDKTKIEQDIYSDSMNPENAQIADWWNPKDLNDKVRVGWKNSKDRGLYIYEWRNPNPEKIVETIDIISFNTQLVPIILAITGEKL
ncbi:MAG: beta-galactosidase trimerization domain-containing protein [Candidatus Firestonebacteria bacterium]